MAVKFELIEGGRVREQLRNGLRARHRRQFLFQVRHTLAEGQMPKELDKADQVAALPAAVAVEQVLAGIHIERRVRLLMQRTQPHELRPGASAKPLQLRRCKYSSSGKCCLS